MDFATNIWQKPVKKLPGQHCSFPIPLQLSRWSLVSYKKRTKGQPQKVLLVTRGGLLRINGLLDLLVLHTGHCMTSSFFKKAFYRWAVRWKEAYPLDRPIFGCLLAKTYHFCRLHSNIQFLSLSLFHLKHSTHIILIRLVAMTSLYKRQTRNSTQKYDW